MVVLQNLFEELRQANLLVPLPPTRDVIAVDRPLVVLPPPGTRAILWSATVSERDFVPDSFSYVYTHRLRNPICLQSLFDEIRQFSGGGVISAFDEPFKDEPVPHARMAVRGSSALHASTAGQSRNLGIFVIGAPAPAPAAARKLASNAKETGVSRARFVH